MKSSFLEPQLETALSLVQNRTTARADKVLKVPFDYYRSTTYSERERKAIWEWAPLVLGSSAEIANNNDYLVRKLFGKSILLVRGEDGIARAFENYCRHRGASPAKDKGNQNRFICPYHGWTFDSSGQLKGIPGRESFESADCSMLNLLELPSEERHGMLWVKFTADTEINVAEFLGPELDAELAAWNYEERFHIPEASVEVNANWKAVIENFAETYHFSKVHADSIPGEIQVPNTSTHDALGLHYRQLFPFKTITDLQDIPRPEWKVLEQATVVYWIFPCLIVVNVMGVTQFIQIFPLDDETSLIRNLAIGSGDPGDAETAESVQQTIDAARYALIEEDGPILNGLGESIRFASHDAAVVGENEIGVQHMVRTISERLDFPIES